MTVGHCSYVRASVRIVDLCRALEAGTATPITQTEEAANHQRVICESCRDLDEPIEFLIVVVETAGECRPDQGVFGVVERPPRAFEIEQGAFTFGQLGWFSHSHSLPGSTARYKYPTVLTLGRRADRSTLIDQVSAQFTPFVIGVAGGTCSGKTTIAERLSELAGAESVALIKLDSYYVASTAATLEERALSNYDHPDTFDWELLNDHLVALAAGASIDVPVYDYADFVRTDRARRVDPSRIIVVEGILVLYEPRLRERFDLRVFVDTDADIRLIRRLRRDVAERGRTPESIINQYLATVRPSHEQFIEPSKRYADVILPHGGMNERAIQVLLARVRELVRMP